MFRFLMGVVLGVFAAAYFRLGERTMGRGGLSDLQRRANAGLEESRRVLEETGEELKSAAASSVQNIQSKAERIRRAVENPETVSTGWETGEGERPATDKGHESSSHRPTHIPWGRAETEHSTGR